MSNSSLVNYTKISPNSTNPRKDSIKKITIHHMAGNLSVEGCGDLFAQPSRQASANYGIGSDGRAGLYVEEHNRAWTSGNADNDNQAVTIEVANCKGAPNWEVSDAAYNKLIDLCVDICKRNNIKELVWTGDKTGTLTCHYMFAATACPGPYLKSKMPEIAQTVNARLSETLYRVQVGAYSKKENADSQLAKVKAAGFDTYMVQSGGYYKIQVGAYSIKSNADAMLAKVKAAGFDAFITTEQPAAAKPAEQKPASPDVQQQNGISAGQQLTLKNTALYNSETSGTVANRLTGTYFVWSSEVINGRIKITNRIDRVGVKGQVTGFINVADINK